MAKELSVAEKLKQMYELQLVDSEMSEIEILKGELPMEVKDLEDEIEGLRTRIGRLEGDVDGVKQEVNNHKNNIKEAEALIEKYNKQMDNVKNNREYDALSKELELQKLEIQLSEKKIREADKTLKAKEETLKATQERHEQKENCGGCYNKIPPQIQLEIGNRKKIIACEHCGRILVDDHILSLGKEPKEKVEA